MTRSHILALFTLVAAVPAVAIGANTLFSAAEAPCFPAGNVGYRLTGLRSADFTVKIDNASAKPDLALQLVDDPALADFVLADGIEAAGACSGLQAVRTIRVDAQAREPDLTVALRSDDTSARYKIYAHSADFTAQDAAALFAVMIQTGRRSVGLRGPPARNDDITGSLTPRSPQAARQ